MRITSVVENTCRIGLPVEHGLSLYLTLADDRHVLFDMGQGSLFVRNADALGLDVRNVDMAVVSHGHYDHGGGLAQFLSENTKAKIYVHRAAFQAHYSLRDTGMSFIGIDSALSRHPQIELCEALKNIDSYLTLFANVQGDCCNPVGNRLLYGPDDKLLDNFCHEQNLLVREGDKTVLFAGCAHRGIVNIMRRATEIADHAPTHVFAGMHLVKSGMTEREEDQFIRTLADHLLSYEGCRFYTMHCTGTIQYEKLKNIMGDRISYISCGDAVDI